MRRITVTRERLTLKYTKWLLQASCFLIFNLAFIITNSPARADRLQSWRFDPAQNRLDFTTDAGVQPRAQLIQNPARLIIDLPGINFGRPQTTDSYNGAIRAVRVGQFERGTTRIVVELAPGYTIDPTQVTFRGVTAEQWTVQIPTPQLIGSSGNPGSTPIPSQPIPDNPAPSSGQAMLMSLQSTSDGFFIRSSGALRDIRSLRSGDKRQMYIDLYGATISPNLSDRDLMVNRNGVSRIQISQFQLNPAVVRLTLTLSPDSPNWTASSSRPGEIVVLPQTGGSAPTAPRAETSTIQSVELQDSRLVVQANQPITYSTGWDRPTGAYRITIPSAQLDRNIQGPKLPANSPLLQVRLRQDDPKTVSILLTPAAGIQIGDTSQSDPRQVVLSLRRGLFPTIPPTGPTTPTPIPTPLPPRPLPGPPTTPRQPTGRLVVVIDPGHGGPDPGAVGIGGIYEKNIVLDVSQQVAALLEQAGIQAVLTRSSDIDLDLQPRVDIAERARATIFVSIHANAISMSRPDVNGLETFYFDSGFGLAQSIHSSVLQATGTRDRRVRQARFYVIRRTSMPSVLVETGFVTGAEDAPKLATPAYRRLLAEGIARGIINYLR
jgi:N-acetylmuramoyl-L-alanine amidase